MKAEDFLVAVEDEKIVGIGRLKDHSKIYELCSIGIIEDKRKQGVGKLLVEELLHRADKEVYITTIIPEYFNKLGFKKTSKVPKELERKAEWCDGCNKEKCVVMKWSPE